MATISSLTGLLGAAVDLVTDLIPIVDMSAAGTARNKKITVGELKEAIAPGTAAALDIDIDDTLAADSDSLIPTQQAVKAYVDNEIAGVGGGGVDVEDEGVSETVGATVLNFIGAGVTAADAGGGQVDITIPGGGGVDVEDEGVAEATGATTLNFTGGGVTATDVGGGQVDVDIPGGGGWTVHGGTPFTIVTPATEYDFTGLGSYNEIVVIGVGLTTSSSGFRGLRLSVNGGSSYYSASGDYKDVTAAGVANNNTLVGSHATAATAARDILVRVLNNVSGVVKICLNQQGAYSRFDASTSVIDAIRVMSTAGNLTGGSITILGR